LLNALIFDTAPLSGLHAVGSVDIFMVTRIFLFQSPYLVNNYPVRKHRAGIAPVAVCCGIAAGGMGRFPEENK
jgi:hypothetical protein